MTTVLIVDDDPAIRLLLYHYLAPEFLVLEAGDGETGIRQAQAYKPEIVLLNLDMPGIDGYETTRRLKTFPIDRRPIVFIVTSHTTADRIHRHVAYDGRRICGCLECRSRRLHRQAGRPL